MAINSTFTNLLKSSVNQVSYSINTALLQVNTFFPATVISVDNTKLTATIVTSIIPVGVNQQSPGPVQITNVPICQYAGGGVGVIIELKKDDVVLCGAIQRDISLIKKAWYSITARNPASYRKFNISDAVILMCLVNTPSTTYVKITQDGIEITGNDKPITINSGAKDVTINCTNAKINSTADVVVTAQGNAKVLATGRATVEGLTVYLGGSIPLGNVLYNTPSAPTPAPATNVFIATNTPPALQDIKS